jgi:hypothetical protein
MGKSKSNRVRRFPTVDHRGGITKKPDTAERKRRPSGSNRDYKKSVSNSLVYRSLKIDNDGYIGFKVTYSGKGTKVNYDRSKLSIILIPDIHFIRAYRPLAGAIARETKGEVIVCTYSTQAGYNERLVSVIVNRSRYVKSKLRAINIVSENEGILSLFKNRLQEIDQLSEKLVRSIDTRVDLEDSFEDAPSSPSAVPRKVTVVNSKSKKRHIQLIRIRRREEKETGSSFSRIVKSVMSRLVSGLSVFTSSGDKPCPDVPRGVFEVTEKKFKVNEKLSLSNAIHCDIIAREMLKRG